MTGYDDERRSYICELCPEPPAQLDLLVGEVCDLCSGARVVESPFELEHAQPMPCPKCSPMSVWLSWVRNPYGISSACPSCKAPGHDGERCRACRNRSDDRQRCIPELLGQLGLSLPAAERWCEVGQ